MRDLAHFKNLLPMCNFLTPKFYHWKKSFGSLPLHYVTSKLYLLISPPFSSEKQSLRSLRSTYKLPKILVFASNFKFFILATNTVRCLLWSSKLTWILLRQCLPNKQVQIIIICLSVSPNQQLVSIEHLLQLLTQTAQSLKTIIYYNRQSRCWNSIIYPTCARTLSKTSSLKKKK